MRQEQLRQNTDEHRIVENLTIVFDTLNGQLQAKELRLTKITGNRTVHTEQQLEIQTTETKAKKERQMVKEERQTEIRTERKEKSTPNRPWWWIVGGIAILAAIGWYFKKLFAL